ncbi:hypothetical protein SLEP1_g10862 [Rubroshorea leprosula]|uniref:Uncharacterized protein n=1 Tax=Rubroshorea leprosula TaxID=152421 RepID=A0AAV5IF75_9ROSI|nr:hypothetical protein SLEP1_g10862 [Rubroshorea leprosula]
MPPFSKTMNSFTLKIPIISLMASSYETLSSLFMQNVRGAQPRTDDSNSFTTRVKSKSRASRSDSYTAVTMDILASKYIPISRSRNNCLEIHIKSRISCLARSPGPEITTWRYISDLGYFAWHLVASIIADLSIGVSTPRIHLGALQVNPGCRYGLKEDFWSARGGNSSQPLGRGQVPSNLPPHPLPPIPNTIPHVDHTEGRDENQPHNSTRNSASIANQDVVATQLAAMQQQFGVFQLVLAQLLARNNPGDPLINLLNPAPSQPPAPPQNPEPVQHAPAISESQGQSHFAPVQQPLHGDVTRRLSSLEKLVVEQRGAPPPHPATDSVPHPLNTNIILAPYPVGFRIPQLETYDGTKDLDDHLHAFYSCMQAQNASDALMCKIFPSTRRGNARTWYYSLPLRSINSYTEMESAFATKFSSRRLIRKTTSELMRVKQRDGESLKNFMSRFNDAVLEVNSFDQAVGITAIISGLSHERFRDSLLKHPAHTFSEVNDRSLKFITAEEYALSQNLTPLKNQHPDWRDENPSRKRMKATQNRGPMSTSTLRFERPNSAPPQQPADHGLTTEQCNSLRSDLESLAQKGMLNEYIQRVAQPRFVREQGPQHQEVHNPPNRQGVGYQQAPPPLPPPARVIHMITGGLEAGGLSSKQRKLYVREVEHQNRTQKWKFDDVEWKNQPITFTSADLETVVTPHNDPLVTSVTINNYEVQRVLVDTGSAPDIIYFHCFESFGLDPALLQRCDGPIYGFNNQPVPVEGVLTMNVAFGSGRSYVTPSVSSPPLLTKAKDGEILYLYLGISDEAISSVLVREEAKQQKPIYYISSVLHGAELRYPIAEKAALAVVTSARKLRPYFQSHPIIILTDQPLRQILQKPECSGRLIKWAVELGEFEITFQQRSAIRAQALADFIIECTPGNSIPTPEPNDWTLYVDGASSSKALLLGLQLALELKLSAIQVYNDSQLVVNQINSICEVVDPVMVKYVALVAELKCKFQKFCLNKIPRTENEQADSLSKFASDIPSHSRSVFVEVLDEPSFMKPREAMKLRRKASRYTLVDGVLYKRSFSLPLLRCLNPYEAEYALREVHEGVCGSHVGARTLAHKVLRHGYYWPNMYKDATYFVQRCLKCQFFAHLTHQPAEELTTLVAPWPFAQWGLDLLGPFVKGVGGVTHLIVGVDYFTKWVEARPLSSITSKKFTSVYHPESNGMVESVNKCILEGIKPRLEQHKAKWADELNNVLWAYRTTSRTATGETPYHLAFSTEAVIPIEIGVPSFRVTHFDEGRNGQLLRENLDLLDDVREEARLRTLVYKQKIANFYNKRVRPRTFKVGDLVFKKVGLTGFETRFGKLAPNWEGPYTVAEVLHPGAYILRDTEGKRVPRV